MKILLSITLLLPVLCWGQKKKAAPTKYASGFFVYGQEAYGKVEHLPASYSLILLQDTIPCIMLLCDTSFTSIGTSLDVYDGDGEDKKTIYKIPNRIPYVWWQFGYISKKLISETIGEKAEDYKAVFKTNYLGENKKRLPKSLVVWMVKEIK